MALLFFMASTAGCSTKSEANTSFKEISDSIIQEADLSDMQAGEGSNLQKLYEIDPDKLENYIIYTPSANIEAEELVLLQVKDVEDMKDIEDKIEKRIASKADSFQEYLPEEYYLVENCVLKTEGEYLLFLVASDADKVGELFEEFFK